MIRKELLSNDLTRPEWVEQVHRDPEKIWLDKNECSDSKMRKIVLKSLIESSSEATYAYPDLDTLYSKIAKFSKVSPENILITAGSDGAIRACFETCIAPGDKIVLTRPTFAMYSVYSKIYGAKVTWLDYSATDNGPDLGVDAFIRAIKKNTPKMVCLANPDSPTGTIFIPSDLEKIVIAAAKVGAIMLIDEAYHPLYQWTAAPWIYQYKHLVVVRSFSKAWGAAGLRVGYAIADSELITYLHKQKPMYEIGAVSAKAIENLLDYEKEMYLSVGRINAGKRYFQDKMRELGLVTYESEGNFLHVKFGQYSDKIHEILKNKVYYRKDFSEISLEGYSRFSVTTKEQFLPIVKSITSVVKNSK